MFNFLLIWALLGPGFAILFIAFKYAAVPILALLAVGLIVALLILLSNAIAMSPEEIEKELEEYEKRRQKYYERRQKAKLSGNL